jgi:hypothetical protein
MHGILLCGDSLRMVEDAKCFHYSGMPGLQRGCAQKPKIKANYSFQPRMQSAVFVRKAELETQLSGRCRVADFKPTGGLPAAYANRHFRPKGRGLNFVELGSFALQNSISGC